MAAKTVSEEEVKRLKETGFLNLRGTDNFSARVIAVNGQLTTDQVRRLADAADRFGDGRLMMTTSQAVEILGIPYDRIEECSAFIKETGLMLGGTGPRVRPIISCKGTTCQYGLIDTYELAEEIHHRFFEGYRDTKLPNKFKIAVGGCPNNCAKPDLHDVGIIGQRIPHPDTGKCKKCKKCQIESVCPAGAAARTEDGILCIDEARCIHCGRCVGKCPFGVTDESTPGYKLYIGGRGGKHTAPGYALGRIFTDKDEALNTIDRILHYYMKYGKPGEYFQQTIGRMGFDQVEKALLESE